MSKDIEAEIEALRVLVLAIAVDNVCGADDPSQASRRIGAVIDMISNSVQFGVSDAGRDCLDLLLRALTEAAGVTTRR